MKALLAMKTSKLVVKMQKRSKVIDRERPVNAKDSEIVELKDEKGLWYVYMHSGIDQRVAFLNNIFKALNLDWTAESRKELIDRILWKG